MANWHRRVPLDVVEDVRAGVRPLVVDTPSRLSIDDAQQNACLLAGIFEASPDRVPSVYALQRSLLTYRAERSLPEVGAESSLAAAYALKRLTGYVRRLFRRSQQSRFALVRGGVPANRARRNPRGRSAQGGALVLLVAHRTQ